MTTDLHDWYWKRRDTLPLLVRQLTTDDGNPIDLSGASVTFFFGPADGSSPSQAADGVTTITDAANGIVQFAPTEVDTSTVGNYRGEFECIIGGKRLTVPNGVDPVTGRDEYFLFRVTQDLGDA